MRLLVIHNLCFYNRLMEEIRYAIEKENYKKFKNDFISDMEYGEKHPM